MPLESKQPYDTIENWVTLFKDAQPETRPAIAQEWLDTFVAKQRSARAHANMLQHTSTIREMVWAIPPAKTVRRRIEKWLGRYIQVTENMRTSIGDLYDLWLHTDMDRRLATLRVLAQKQHMRTLRDPELDVDGCAWIRSIAWDAAVEHAMHPEVLSDVLEITMHEYPWDYMPDETPKHPLSDALGIIIIRCRRGFAHLPGHMATDSAKAILVEHPQIALSLLRFVEAERLNAKPLHGDRPTEARAIKVLATWLPGYKQLLKTTGDLGMSYSETMAHVYNQIMTDGNSYTVPTLPDNLGVAS